MTDINTPPTTGMSLGMESRGLRALSKISIPDYFWNRTSTDVPVLDEIFNGDGIVPSQCFTLAAPRGSGKTTFLLQTMQALITANRGYKAAYLSGEEIVEQLAFNAQRYNAMDVVADNETDIDKIVNIINCHQMVVIDSVSSLRHSSIKGEKALEEYAVNTLVKAAKASKCSVIFVQHFTKDGKEKGGTLWGHTVDTCMSIHKLDIEEYGENARLIEVEKNRFGTATDVILRLTKEGFDFDNPIVNLKKNETAKGGNRALNKIQDIRKIMDRVKTKDVQIADLKDICDDFGRTERLLKELEKSGRLVKIGRGPSAKYTLGDFDDDSDDSNDA